MDEKMTEPTADRAVPVGEQADFRDILSIDVGSVLTRLASADPQWGGGSAVLLGASMGTCLLAMSARIGAAGARAGTFAPELSAADLERIGDELAARAEELAAWAAKDGTLYGRVVSAQRLPKDQPEARSAAILEALRGAIEGPLQVSLLIMSVLQRAQDLAGNCKKANFSDIASGVRLLHQGIRGALLNVRQNCGKRECFAAHKLQAEELGEAADRAVELILRQCR